MRTVFNNVFPLSKGNMATIWLYSFPCHSGREYKYETSSSLILRLDTGKLKSEELILFGEKKGTQFNNPYKIKSK